MNRYPTWRYILIVLLTVFGVLYALPNLPQYGNDYAIQVTTNNSSLMSSDVKQKVVTALQKQNIPYLGVSKGDNNLLVRFKENSEQTKAQDVVQATLGSDYAVALNLAPKTPTWLQALGAEPMKLGLDLKGGIHFLLYVDVPGMLEQRERDDLHSFGDQLRSNNIRYSGIKSLGSDGLLVRFKNAELRDKAESVLSKNFTDYSYSKLQQGDVYTLQAAMRPEQLIKISQLAVEQNIATLKHRVNALGVGESRVVQQGKNNIAVDLPGIQDTAQAKNLIGKTASVQMRLVDIEHDAQVAQSSGIVPFGSTLYLDNGRPILVKNQVILSGRAITGAVATVDQNGRPAVSITSSGSSVAYFNQVTSENVGKPMAVVYIESKPYKVLEDGKVVTKTRQISKIISVATINSGLGNSFQIMGLDSNLYAKNLALLLRSGAYSATMSFAQEKVVGPSLGSQNIHMGVLACEIGSLAVFIFMIIYYRFFGVVADIALILNVIFLIAVMSVMGFTLTLPGIAAIILTVGMAVDANVLIYERIREELRAGMSPQAAISAGYGRAFTTIVDANVTTLIVAIVLFALGTGPVQGFAISLIIGLLVSMVTSIFFTRALVNLYYGGRQHLKNISIGIKVKAN